MFVEDNRKKGCQAIGKRFNFLFLLTAETAYYILTLIYNANKTSANADGDGG